MATGNRNGADGKRGNQSVKKIRTREIRFDQDNPEVGTRNTELGIVTYTFVFLFIILVGYLVYLNIWKVDSLNSNVYNTKHDVNMDKYIRGSILSADGTVLAETQVADDGTETRVYPCYNMFAHAVGYATNGKSGIESAYNSDLLSSHASILTQIRDESEKQKARGDTLVTTLNYSLQNTAYQALGGYNGAVLALEPDTGKILAMVSKPDYDPNRIGELWEDLISDESSSVLLNRATQGLYPPGSIFKILTALSYMRQKPGAYQNFSYECTSELTKEGVTISCYNHTVHGTEDLKAALSHSCNTAFASIGLELDSGDFHTLCEEFLFNKALPTTLMHSTSKFTLEDKASYGERMMTAIGQGSTLVTPLHMALIAATVANGGIMMRPYMVDHMETYDGDLVSTTKPSAYKRLMTTEEARILKEFMTETVTAGTATELGGYGFTAAGKTGSAEFVLNGEEGTHSWFIGFSNVEDPDLAVAVIAENGGTGSDTAVPIAAQIFRTYYGV